MPIIVKLQDIDEAIENLRYKNETTLKSRLLRAVRQYYQDDASAESLQSIDAEELVKTVWETGDDSDLLKTKRKNFSSLKSSVNSDLKKLYAEGKNTQGIVIGHNNVFSISDEAKDKALAGIMDVFKEKGIDTQSKISEILSVLSDILSTSISETDAENTKEEIDRLKNILGGISGKLGLSLQDIVRRAGAMASGGAQISGSDTTPRDMPGKGMDLSGFIRGGLSEIDKGLQGLAREIEEASASVAQTGVMESVRRALQDIVETLKDSGTDTTGKARKIMAAVERMLTDAINAPGNELSRNQAGQLKQIFHEMTEGAREALPVEGNVEADKMATPVQIAGGELLARVSSILSHGGLSATDHPAGWQDKISQIMTVVNHVVGEALADGGTGLNDDEIAGIKETIGNITGHLEALVQQTLTDAESAGGDAETGVQEAMRTALQGIIEALHDAGTDTPGKAKKMMAAVEGMLADAIDALGNELSGDQAEQLKQIFHEMSEGAGEALSSEGNVEADKVATPAQIAGGQLLATVSSILGNGGLSAGDKISQIMAAVKNMIDEALGEADGGLGSADQAKIQEIMANITSRLEALAGLEIVEEEVLPPAGVVLPRVPFRVGVADGDATQQTVGLDDASFSTTDDTVAIMEEVSGNAVESGADAEGLKEEIAQGAEAAGGVEESISTGLQDIIQAFQDDSTDATGKAKKIMDAVEGMLADAIDASGDALSGDQAGQLTQIFHEMTQGAGSQLLSEVNSILGDGGLSAIDEGHAYGWQDKISKIMAVVNDMIGEALSDGDTGLSEKEIAEIKEMIGNVTGNLEALAQEALAGVEIFEEITGEDAGDSFEVGVAGGVAADTDLIEEIIEEGTGNAAGGTEEIVDAPAQAGDSETAGGMEEIVETGAGDAFEIIEEAIGEGPEAFGDAVLAEVDSTATGDDSAKFIEAENAAAEGLEEISDGIATTETQSPPNAAETGAREEFEEQDFIEEIVEDTGNAASGVQVTPADSNIDNDLREKTDLLTRLAEAAGVLSGMGPDLSGSVYTEEEIRGKAQFLSEEFDRYLSIRDKFYNAHILIKGGDYLVGGAHLAKSVLAEQIVTLPDFYISKFPITNALFEIFVEQTGYVTTAEKYGYSLVYFPRMQRSRDPITGVERFSLHNQAYSKKVPGACWHRPQGPDSSLYLKRTHPVVHVSLEDACAFAVWTGKRLPSEIEWEASARTAHGLTYPWGSKWQDDACNIEKSLHGDTTPVDRYAKFANSAGVADMLGNVLEWTSDVIGDRETSDTFIVKGAGWIAHDEISLTDRHYIEKNTASNILGFRCVAI